jgi:hypothetical protein
MKTYAAYRFITKDPAIAELQTVIEDHFGRRVTGKELVEVKDSGGPAAGTMRSWFFGKTRRPQNATLEAAGRALGYRRKWIKTNGKKAGPQG